MESRLQVNPWQGIEKTCHGIERKHKRECQPDDKKHGEEIGKTRDGGVQSPEEQEKAAQGGKETDGRENVPKMPDQDAGCKVQEV
jgi:hypothetical protein